MASHKEGANLSKGIVIGAVSVGMGTLIPSWDSLAHGNRSSHPTISASSWAPERYILMREELVNPGQPQTIKLKELYTTLDNLDEGSLQYNEVIKSIGQIETKLKLSKVTKTVVDFVEKGELDAARAVLDGTGSIETQLDSYIWALSDAVYYDEETPILTSAKSLKLIEPLSQLALEKSKEALTLASMNQDNPFNDVVKIKVATLLHNVANYCLPDKGQPTEQSLRLGVTASEQALELRRALERDVDTSRAMTITARYYAKQGNIENAKTLFSNARDLATKSNNKGATLYASVMEKIDLGTNPVVKTDVFTELDNIQSRSSQNKLFTPEVGAVSSEGISYEDLSYLRAFVDENVSS